MKALPGSGISTCGELRLVARQARHVDSKAEEVSRQWLRSALGGRQALPRSRGERGAPVFVTESNLGDIRTSDTHCGEEFAPRRISAHTPPSPQRDPHAALGVDRRAVRITVGGRYANEH